MKIKRHFANLLERLKKKPTLTRQDILLAILPGLLWYGVFHTRVSLVSPSCTSVETCSTANIPWIDQVALGRKNRAADHMSFYTQYFAGALAIFVPVGVSVTQVASGTLPVAIAFQFFSADLIFFTQTTLWNGVLNDSMRFLTQRPRPFVYDNPKAEGQNPAHYSSFYSGHTSFSAAITMFLIITLLGRRISRFSFWFWSSLGFTTALATGSLRVIAGRHFPTDVLAGLLAGTLVALALAIWHRRTVDKRT